MRISLNKYNSSGGITPSGTISIIENGTYDVTNKASANVAVPVGKTYATIPVVNLTYPESVENCGAFNISGPDQQLKTAFDKDICYITNDEFDNPIPVYYKHENEPDEAGRVYHEIEFESQEYYYWVQFWTDAEGDVMNSGDFPINYELGYQNSNYEEANITPTTEEQEITPESTLWFNKVNVSAVDNTIDSNITAGNIKKDVTILGVTGTLESGGGSFEINATNKIKLCYSGFKSLPENITFNVSDWSHMFASCSGLTTIPSLDTSNGTNFSFMFQFCGSLTTIPALDTSNGTNFSFMLQNCSSLTTIPALDTSKGTNFTNMFTSCSGLTTIPSLDTSKGTNFTNMFSSCIKLTTIEGIDFSGLTTHQTSASYIFNTNTGNVLITMIVNGVINYSLNFSYLVKIDYDSVKSILTAASNTTNTDAKTLTFNRTMTDQEGELAALVSTCTSKGWTITGLTLN